MAPSEFWNSTLHETAVWVRARGQHVITASWYTAAMHRAKRLDPLDKLLGQTDPDRAQAYQNQMAERIRHHMQLAAAQLNGT